jgi:hypothetical protein
VKASIIVASSLTAILVLPQLVFGTLTGAEAIVATIHSFCAAFLVMIFAPQLAQFVPHDGR